MNHKAAVEAIAQLEQSYDVNAARYGHWPLWVLVRRHLWTQLLQLNASDSSLKASAKVSAPKVSAPSDADRPPSSPDDRPASVLHGWQRWQAQQQAKNALKEAYPSLAPIDLLFFSRVEDYTDRIDGKFYNRHLDPLVEWLSPRYSCLKVELNSRDRPATQPRFAPTTTLRMKSFGVDTLPSPHARRLENFDGLMAAVDDRLGIKLSEDWMLRQVDRLQRYETVFLRTLPLLQPQLAFLVCYYSLPGLAFISACHQLGIPTVDVQHGKQGKYHGMYSHWTRLPADGYSLLPSFYWVWGEESRQNIERWYPPDNNAHQPIVGGNRWLARWVNAGTSGTHVSQADRKTALVSLQPIAEPIPSALFNAIAQSAQDWQWILRLHPHQSAQKSSLQEQLEARSLFNVRLETAADAPLYARLQQATIHLTAWSSVCYEALAFRVPTLIFHPTGQELYREAIATGQFLYAETTEEILATLRSDLRVVMPQIPYIETRNTVAESALQTMLERSRRSPLHPTVMLNWLKRSLL